MDIYVVLRLRIELSGKLKMSADNDSYYFEVTRMKT
jgi:hypothetical protein